MRKARVSGPFPVRVQVLSRIQGGQCQGRGAHPQKTHLSPSALPRDISRNNTGKCFLICSTVVFESALCDVTCCNKKLTFFMVTEADEWEVERSPLEGSDAACRWPSRPWRGHRGCGAGDSGSRSQQTVFRGVYQTSLGLAHIL